VTRGTGLDVNADRRHGPNRPGRAEIVALMLILVLGAALRLAYLVELRDDPGLTTPPVDAGFNLYWARGLATGDWTLPSDAQGRDPKIPETAFMRPPGYPYVLALLIRITGGSALAIRGLQMVAGLLAAALSWWAGRRLLSPLVGLVWAGLTAVHWAFIYFEGDLNGTWLLTLLFPTTVLVLQRLAASGLWRDGALLGALIGLTALIRSNGLLLGIVLGGWLLAVVARRRGLRRGLVGLGAAAAAGVLVLVPTTIRNARVSGHLVPVSANGGITLYNGNNPDATGISSAVSGEAGFFASPWHGADVIARASAREGRPVDYVEASRNAGREAWRWIKTNPDDALRLIGLRALLFWGPDEIAHSSPIAADRAASPLLRRLPFGFALIVAGGIWGPAAWAFARRRSAVAAMPEATAATMVAVALITGGWFVSFLPFLVSSLYRMTVVPCLLLAASVGVAATLRLARTGHALSPILLGGGLIALWLILRVPLVPVDPGWTERLVQRGLQWRAQGELVRAETELREALHSSPGSQRAANGLAAVLLDERRFGEAATVLEPAVAAGCDDPALHFNLGLARVATGDWAGAVAPLRAATELAPNLAEAQVLLASACERIGDQASAITAYERALAVEPDRIDVANNLAWLLATTVNDHLRDGPRAVDLAQRVVASTRTPATLDTLAAAYAETGRFDDAVVSLEEALDLASRGRDTAVSDLEDRLELYRSRRPFRLTADPH